MNICFFLFSFVQYIILYYKHRLTVYSQYIFFFTREFFCQVHDSVNMIKKIVNTGKIRKINKQNGSICPQNMNTDVIYLQPKVNMYFFGKSRDITPKQIKLTIMVLDLVHKFQMTCLGDHQLLSKIQLWCGHTY